MKYFLYIVLITGVILILNKWLVFFFLDIKDLKNIIFSCKESKLTLHIKRLITSLYESQSLTWIKRRVTLFFILSGSITLISLCLFIQNNFFGVISIGISILFGILPYLWLRIKFTSRQIIGSYEGQIAISEILDRYKINHYNIIHAIDEAIKYLDDAPFAKQLLFKMALELKVQRTDKELQRIMDDFVYGCGTEWGKMLSLNIYFAVSEAIDITSGLEDLLSECEYAKEMLEQMKRTNQEAFLLVKFLAPTFYVVLIWTLIKVFQLSITEVFAYQFFTPMGSLIFMVLAVVSFSNYAIVTLLSKPKFDI